MSADSWVKNYRKLEQWQWYKRPHYAHLWQHLIRKAQFEQRFNVNGQKVDRGQVDFSIRQLSGETGVSVSVVRKFLEVLENSTEISTVHKGKNLRDLTIISITNYEHYQSASGGIAQQTAQQAHSNRTVTAQQAHNFKNVKNVKNVKNGNTTSKKPKHVELSDLENNWLSFFDNNYLDVLITKYDKDYVYSELEKARIWLIGNHETKKRSNPKRFMTNWLLRNDRFYKKPTKTEEDLDNELEEFFAN